MQIRLNGKDQEVKEGITVTQLLEELKIHPERVAVVVNQEVVKRASYASTILQGGDKVEILTVMAGGVEERP
jgi:sulfur carrier protein